MADHMRLGDVIRYDASGHPRGRVTLPPDADPIELIEDHGQVLITDAALFRVHRVTLQGQPAGAWGPGDLNELFGAISAERGFRRSLHYMSYGLIVAGVLAALFVVGFELRRQRAQRWSTFGDLAPVTAPPAPLGREAAWLPIEPEVLRRTRPVMWFLGAYTLAIFGILLWLATELRVDTPIGRYRVFLTAAVSSVALLLLVVAAVGLRRLPRRRIGISRAEVLYDPGAGDIARSRWEDVRVGPRGMLIGRHLIQIVDMKGRYLYSRPEYEARLLSHLSPTAFLGGSRLLIEAMRRGNMTLWITGLAFAVYLVFTLLRWLQPGLMTRLSAQLIDLFR
jgi:hypothetical protein